MPAAIAIAMVSKIFRYRKIALVLGLLTLAALIYWWILPGRQIDFSADVKPILNKKCISCHGGVKAKAGFSLLFHEEAMAPTESGKPAIIPGNPDGSEMIRRLTLKDPEERMPYKHEPLSKEEIETLRLWIRQGAKWGDHWAYLPVAKQKVPEVNDAWAHSDIDAFISEKLVELKLTPSVRADKATLLRRVSLDLIGMYPGEEIAKQYLNDAGANAYENLVDILLASKHFGERWASVWLDIARYADTKGYESDGGREIWKYRDWVIDAFNSDMRYDSFLTNQIAGDLLSESPTDAQFIATAFSRNSMTNDEGGTDNEEFRNAAVMDRVNTTWEGLMGTTFACVQCHSHPYDPFRHDEYYKFFAFFNNTRDEDVAAEYPLLRQFPDSLKADLNQVVEWVRAKSNDRQAHSTEIFLRTFQPSINTFKADDLNKAAAIGNSNTSLFFRNRASARLRNVKLDGAGQMIWNFYSNQKKGVLQLRLDSLNGPLLASYAISQSDKWRMESIPLLLEKKGIHDIYLLYETPSIPADAENFLVIFDWVSFQPSFPGKGMPGFQEMEQKFWALMYANMPTTPVMLENPKWMWRKTHVFDRGNWRTLGKEVEPAVPASLAYAMPKDAPNNRLGLAAWLTSEKNPLVSRTIVNRVWEQLFGTGIAETLEDMGTQGLPPTHQKLLDHLAYQFMHEDGWSLKALLKKLVMSATYQQDSRVSPGQLELDPFNRYYARGPRVRLSAEQLRDQHLSISGALSTRMYGPGVMPWQPDGIWLSPYNGQRWKNSEGEDQYRRAIYTYWKRTSPYPSAITFDAAQRVVCNARRIRTNTPLQALVTLNDSAYLNIARHFASWMWKRFPDNTDKQIRAGYEKMMFKSISTEKMDILTNLYQQALKTYRADSESCKFICGVEFEKASAEAAALVLLANALLNLDEIVTKS